MKKCILISMLFISLTACAGSTDDPQFYFSHPEQLRQKASECQGQESKQCQLVLKYHRDASSAALAIQANPQAFGVKILMTQQKLVQAEKKGQQKEIEKYRYLNTLYTSVISWLESPEI